MNVPKHFLQRNNKNVCVCRKDGWVGGQAYLPFGLRRRSCSSAPLMMGTRAFGADLRDSLSLGILENKKYIYNKTNTKIHTMRIIFKGKVLKLGIKKC